MPTSHSQRWTHRTLTAIAATLVATAVWAHGDVAPQPVNTDALPDVGEEWLIENPYRGVDEAVWQTAVEIGASGYNQNCARCHGLEAVSGGLAPDLRYLEAEEYGDEWYIERFRNGFTQNGITKMPGFGELLGQKAAWAIRTYVESRPDPDTIEPFNDRLVAIRDQLRAWAEAPATNGAVDSVREELAEIASKIETGSGAPVADSIAYRAARQLDGSAESFKTAADTLTIGLSAAR